MIFDPLCASRGFAVDLELARTRVADASDRLRTVLGSAETLAARTAWQTPTARRFHDEASRWRSSIVGLVASAEHLGDQLWWLQLRESARAQGDGP